MAVSSMMAGKLMGRADPRGLAVIGLLCMAFSFWKIAGFSIDVGREAVAYNGLIQGFGIGFVSVPLMTSTFSTLALSARVEGAVLYSMLRNIGAGIGVSIAITILTRSSQGNQARLVESLSVLDVDKWNLIRGVVGDQAEAVYAQEVSRQAAAIGYVNDFTFLLYLSLLSSPLVLVMSAPKSSVPAAAVAADAH